MPEFLVTGPDGKKYRVTGATPEGAKAAVKKRAGVAGASATTLAAPFSGKILPISRQEPGGPVSFDSNAGILGSVKRAFTLPHDVMAGDVDLNTDEGLGRVLEMATTFGPVNPAVRAGDRAIPGVLRATRKVPVPVPSAEKLKAVAGKQYNAVRDMGVDYSATAVRDTANALRQQLEQDGILKELAPKTFSILERLQNPPAGSVAPLAGIDAARKSLRLAAKDFANPTEQLAAQRLIRGLDQFVESVPASSVVAGPAAAAARLNKEARGNYAASKRSDRLTGIEDKATRRAAASNSGRNIDNAIRQRAASVLDDPKKRAGFSKAEIILIEKVANGSTGRNTLRYVGNLLGGGGGLGAALTGTIGGTVGGTLGGPPGLALGLGIPAAGALAKTAGNKMTVGALRKADEATRKRSPLYSKARKKAPMTPISPERRAVIMRMLGLQELNQRPDMTVEEYEAYLRAGGT